jgi:hypothetical protein
MSRLIAGMSWLVSLWICKVFLFSVPYKFSGHPDTTYIFSIIGVWIQDVISKGLGTLFIKYGAMVVGSAELIVSLILLLPAFLLVGSIFTPKQLVSKRAVLHLIGGGMASMVMFGAVFFHLATPLGIEVLHNGQSDGGSLFYSAVSILVLGGLMAMANLFLLKSIR